MEKVTIDLILGTLKGWIENKEIIDAHTWVEACQKMNLLSSEEHDKLFELQQKVAQMKVQFIEFGDSVAKAKAKIEATDEFKEMNRQKAKLEMIEEAIRISKIQSRLKDSEYGNY